MAGLLTSKITKPDMKRGALQLCGVPNLHEPFITVLALVSRRCNLGTSYMLHHVTWAGTTSFRFNYCILLNMINGMLWIVLT